MEVRGKGAFVTGSARGIGRAITEALLEKGAKVMFCDVNEALGVETEKELQQKYGADNVIFVVCDVSDASQLSATFEKAVSAFSRVEIFINNAGILDENNIEKCVAINQIAVMRGTLLAEQHMRKDKGGRGGAVINIASVAGLYAGPLVPVYTATKYAIIGFSVSIAHRLLDSESGLRVMVVCPSAVNTELLRNNAKALDGKTTFVSDMEPSEIGAHVVKLVEEGENGALLEVWKKGKARFVRRIVVDKDGGGNPMYPDDLLIPQMAKFQ